MTSVSGSMSTSKRSRRSPRRPRGRAPALGWTGTGASRAPRPRAGAPRSPLEASGGRGRRSRARSRPRPRRASPRSSARSPRRGTEGPGRGARRTSSAGHPSRSSGETSPVQISCAAPVRRALKGIELDLHVASRQVDGDGALAPAVRDGGARHGHGARPRGHRLPAPRSQTPTVASWPESTCTSWTLVRSGKRGCSRPAARGAGARNAPDRGG